MSFSGIFYVKEALIMRVYGQEDLLLIKHMIRAIITKSSFQYSTVKSLEKRYVSSWKFKQER